MAGEEMKTVGLILLGFSIGGLGAALVWWLQWG